MLQFHCAKMRLANNKTLKMREKMIRSNLIRTQRDERLREKHARKILTKLYDWQKLNTNILLERNSVGERCWRVSLACHRARVSSWALLDILFRVRPYVWYRQCLLDTFGNSTILQRWIQQELLLPFVNSTFYGYNDGDKLFQRMGIFTIYI